MSDITEDTVRHLANLARIALTPDEVTTLTSELAAIVDAVAKVTEVATPDVPATSHPIPMENVWREDVVADQLTAEEALGNAFAAVLVPHVQGVNGVRILGTAPGKGAVMSFVVEGAHAHDVAQVLDRYGVAVRAGLHCAEPLSKRMGVTSSTRASFALYNTVEDADAFVDALIKARNFFV